MWLTPVLLIVLALALASAWRVVRRKNVDTIVAASLRRRPRRHEGTRHIFFCVVDHFEPFWKNDDVSRGVGRVQRWRERYPELAAGFRDRGGRPPRHTFFYPAEDYNRSPDCIEMLAGIVREGFGDVEVHLHHDHDTADSMRGLLGDYTRTLRERHGLLHVDDEGRSRFAFIHGNWVLGNSGRNGAGCGVDNELAVLDELGCYADFTLPSAPHPSQPPVINRIYYPAGDRNRARAHFTGIDARYGAPGHPGPLIINGPLALNWKQRRRGVMPAVENGDLTHFNPPSPDRVDAWINVAVSVAEFPRWVFVKTHTHGAQERNADLLLGKGAGSLSALFADLKARYDDGDRHVLHFSTPWEMYRAVKVLEAGERPAIDAIENFEFKF